MENRHYKLCIVGDCDVGKSAIATRYVHNHFDDSPSSTIGASFLCKIKHYNKSKLHLQLWDTAGQERYRSITPLYYRNAACVILVIDQTNVSSITSSLYWLNSIREHMESMPIFIAINKSELPSNLPQNFIETILEKFPDVKWKNVSAKTNEGIEEFFLEIIKKLYNDSNVPVSNTNTIILDDDAKQKKWYNNCLLF